MAKNQFRGWKVRGFWGDDKTKLVLVKGRKRRIIKVMSAQSANGKWTFTTEEGVNTTLPKDQNKIQVLKKADVVTNFCFIYGQIFFEKVEGELTKLALAEDEYHVAYFSRGILRKKPNFSSPIRKIWKEQGNYHALTMSGAHYIFPIMA